MNYWLRANETQAWKQGGKVGEFVINEREMRQLTRQYDLEYDARVNKTEEEEEEFEDWYG